jgi:hypothetical protein
MTTVPSPGSYIGARCWRFPLSLRIGAPAVLAIVFGAMAYDSRDEDGSWIWPVIGVSGLALFLYANILRPKLCIDGERMMIRNAGRTRTVPRELVHRASPTYYGLFIHLKDRHIHRARAIQKPNYATWLKRRTRADQVADEINLWAASASAD